MRKFIIGLTVFLPFVCFTADDPFALTTHIVSVFQNMPSSRTHAGELFQLEALLPPAVVSRTPSIMPESTLPAHIRHTITPTLPVGDPRHELYFQWVVEGLRIILEYIDDPTIGREIYEDIIIRAVHAAASVRRNQSRANPYTDVVGILQAVEDYGFLTREPMEALLHLVGEGRSTQRKLSEEIQELVRRYGVEFVLDLAKRIGRSDVLESLVLILDTEQNPPQIFEEDLLDAIHRRYSPLYRYAPDYYYSETDAKAAIRAAHFPNRIAA